MYKFFFISLIFLFLNACVQKEVHKNDALNKHIDETQELYKMMHSLHLSVYEKNKSELEIDDEKRRYALNIVSNVKKTGIVLNKYGYKNLKDDNLQNFLNLNEQLQVAALKIESSANKYEIDKLDEQIDAMKNICTACHSKFRDSL